MKQNVEDGSIGMAPIIRSEDRVSIGHRIDRAGRRSQWILIAAETDLPGLDAPSTYITRFLSRQERSRYVFSTKGHRPDSTQQCPFHKIPTRNVI